MGYGKELKKCLDERGICVMELSRRTSISQTTLYSAIKRDSSVRYDYALKIADEIDIDPHRICANVPDTYVYMDDGMEQLIDVYKRVDDEQKRRLLAYAERMLKDKKASK